MPSEPGMEEIGGGAEIKSAEIQTPPPLTADNIAQMNAMRQWEENVKANTPPEIPQDNQLSNVIAAREGAGQFAHDPEMLNNVAPDREDGMAETALEAKQNAEINAARDLIVEQSAYEISSEYGDKVSNRLENFEKKSLGARVLSKLESMQDGIARKEWEKLIDFQMRDLASQMEGGAIDSSAGSDAWQELASLKNANIEYSTLGGGRITVTAANGERELQLGDLSGRKMGRAYLETNLKIKENFGIRLIEGLKSSLFSKRETTRTLKGMVQGYNPTPSANSYPSPNGVPVSAGV